MASTSSSPAPLRAALLFVTCLISSAPVLSAQSEDRVLRALEVLDATLSTETNLSAPTRDALRGVVSELKSERQRAPGESELAAEIGKLVDQYTSATSFIDRKKALEDVFPHLKYGGDFRLRHESSFGQDGRPDRHRQRLRARFWANFAIYEELTLRFRAVSGDADDPNSPHATLGSVFDKLAFNLDRANILYRPEWANGASLTAGKFGHDFEVNPIYGELVWDADVQPEGILLGYTKKGMSGFVNEVSAKAGYYNILEQGGGDDVYAFVLQLAGKFSLGDDASLTASTAYYNYGDTTPNGTTGVLGDNAGNRLIDRSGNGMADDFYSDFGILDSVVAVSFQALELPITIAGEVIWNTRAQDGRDMGWALGLSVGRASKAGDWRVYYSWLVVEQDAVFSPVAQDDFLLQTNHRSHLVGVNYMATDHVGIHLWALISARDSTGTSATTDSDDEQFRIRLDLNIKF